jgi:pre-mRNA-splicing factor SYF2
MDHYLSEGGDQQPTSSLAPMSLSSADDLQARLFHLRMKINQGRKANQAEVEEEFSRISKSVSRKAKQTQGQGEDGAGEHKSKKQSQKESLLQQTAAEAEWEASKARKKAQSVATYGLNAFTNEAYYRAYERKVKKLQPARPNQTSTDISSSALAVIGSSTIVASRLEENPFDYGKAYAQVNDASLEKLKADVLAKEADRKKFSKRRLATDGADVDYINDKNATFNKRLKRAFNKYTVEIRQNLERGTAV